MCPRCRSKNLWIKEKTLWELVLSATSGERSYLCRDCEHNFRAPDLAGAQLEPAMAANSSLQAQLTSAHVDNFVR